MHELPTSVLCYGGWTNKGSTSGFQFGGISLTKADESWNATTGTKPSALAAYRATFIMKNVIVLFLILLSLSGFDNKSPGVYVTIKNGSKETFKNLHIKIQGQDYFFHDLKSGGSTKPINVDKTYRYCYTEVVTKKDTLIFQPTDFVGETLHKSGRLVMELYIIPEEGTDRDLRMR
ncbi:hypothetical protein [Flavisolibacter nicotianae]|uniref:hypothetical protein n=1 Tax=Flavisolibacter nicotianae TaxID=2364882 RepID=UPI0013C50836|nr:hypothetical protein [Flavisolibacter nicotianae]